MYGAVSADASVTATHQPNGPAANAAALNGIESVKKNAPVAELDDQTAS